MTLTNLHDFCNPPSVILKLYSSSTTAPPSHSLFTQWEAPRASQSKPGREDRWPNTQANICDELNWANTDNAGTIAFPVAGRLVVLSSASCRPPSWLLLNRGAHNATRVPQQITGRGLNLLIFACFFSVSLRGSLGAFEPQKQTCASVSTAAATLMWDWCNYTFITVLFHCSALISIIRSTLDDPSIKGCYL